MPECVVDKPIQEVLSVRFLLALVVACIALTITNHKRIIAYDEALPLLHLVFGLVLATAITLAALL